MAPSCTGRSTPSAGTPRPSPGLVRPRTPGIPAPSRAGGNDAARRRETRNRRPFRPARATSSRSQTLRFATLWVTTITVRPSRARPDIISITDMSRPGSRPDVGSSRNSSEGLVSSSRATLTRFCWPPERDDVRVSACAVSDSSPSTSPILRVRSAGLVSRGKRSSAAYPRARCADRCVCRMFSWGTRPIRCRSSA